MSEGIFSHVAAQKVNHCVTYVIVLQRMLTQDPPSKLVQGIQQSSDIITPLMVNTCKKKINHAHISKRDINFLNLQTKTHTFSKMKSTHGVTSNQCVIYLPFCL